MSAIGQLISLDYWYGNLNDPQAVHENEHWEISMKEDLREAFWDAVKSDRVVLLGSSRCPVALRPMTAQVDDATEEAIYFFAARDEGIGSELAGGNGNVTIAFASKDHALFASGNGVVSEVKDKATIDRLCSPIAAIFYDQGRDDPRLILLRLDRADLDIWRNTTTGFIKSIAYKLMGKDAGDANQEDRGNITI